VTGIVLGAAYMLWLYQRTMFGEITKEENKTLSDLNAREIATLIPIIALCFWIGLYPSPFLRAMEVSVANVIQAVEKGAAGKAVQGKKAEVVRPGSQAARQPGDAATGELGDPATGKLGSSGTLIAELSNRPIAASHDREGGR
jgi:hypothetical protein